MLKLIERLIMLIISLGLILISAIIFQSRDFYLYSPEHNYYYHLSGSNLKMFGLSIMSLVIFCLVSSKDTLNETRKIRGRWDIFDLDFSNNDSKNSVYYRNWQGEMLLKYWYLIISCVVLFYLAFHKSDIVSVQEFQKKNPQAFQSRILFLNYQRTLLSI